MNDHINEDSVPWGERLRRWRDETMSWSQQDLVDQIVCLAFRQNEDRGTRLDTRLLSKWENGVVQRPQAVYRRLLSELGAPQALSPVRTRSLANPQPTDEYGGVGSSRAEEISVFRRDFMKLGSGLAVSGLIAGLTGEPASLMAPNRVGQPVVSELRRRIARLRRLDDYLGGADTYHLYMAEVGKTAQFIEQGNYSARTKLDLLAIYSEQAQQAGWAAFDSGHGVEAQRLYASSFVAAKDATDSGLAGNALAFRAYQLVDDASAAATDLTDGSIALADRGAHPVLRALLLERGAWTYAVAGQADETARALELAGAALRDCDSDGRPAPDYAAWVDDVELRIMTGRCWTRLHKPLRAVPALESALAEYPDLHARDKALYLSWLADAYIDADELEQAVSVTTRAIHLAGDVASVRPRQRIAAVLDRLSHHGGVPSVGDLRSLRPPEVAEGCGT